MANKKIATSTKDILMILLYASGATGKNCEPIRGRTRLMKMVFLFKEEIRDELGLKKVIPDEALPDFVPYDYGPFSSGVYSDIKFLEDLGFISSKEVSEERPLPEEVLEANIWEYDEEPSEYSESLALNEQDFYLTDLGKEFVEAGNAGELTEVQWEGVAKFKANLARSSLKSILRYVYENYENMTTKSKIRDSIVGA